jgi:arylformamidase
MRLVRAALVGAALLVVAPKVVAGDQPTSMVPTAKDVPYVVNGHERQVLDVYAPASARNLPVVFWIHGGGWQAGHKGLVARKPQAFTEAGFVFVSINHRLLPGVPMDDIVVDVARAFRWVHDRIASYGGDPSRVFVMGHSSGGQLAALLCTDERRLKAEGLSLTPIAGCVPVDADTFDIPAIIEMAETRARVHRLPQPTYGHRQKFGDDPAKHRDFSAVTHVQPGKRLPPFLIVHVAEHPDTTAQARRFADVLRAASVPVEIVGGRETTHAQINDGIGTSGNVVSDAIFAFVRRQLNQ